MIQRKQTLFLLELVFLSIALLFVPNANIVTAASDISVSLLPLPAGFSATSWHSIAMLLNGLGLVISVISIFLYKKRELQIKLCYTLVILWALLAFILGTCPRVEPGNAITAIQNNYSGLIIAVFAILAAILAARFIKKDIDLLKSADRIR